MYENLGRRFRERRMPPVGLVLLGLASWVGLGIVSHVLFRLFGG